MLIEIQNCVKVRLSLIVKGLQSVRIDLFSGVAADPLPSSLSKF
jgi:altronate dehydratase